jgi:hypothetical protein
MDANHLTVAAQAPTMAAEPTLADWVRGLIARRPAEVVLMGTDQGVQRFGV